MKKLGLVACAAFALTATSASANGFWQNGSYYTYPTATSQSTTTTTTYSAPGANVVGSVGPIQSAGTSTYVQPSTYGTTYTTPYTAPATTYTAPAPASTYTAPTTTYTPPSYSTVPAATNTYVAPTTVYTPPATTTYAPAPRYTVPAYAPPQYDATGLVRDRIRNQRNRIERALDRGELRRGEERRLREGLREIRRTFRAYRDNDGFVGRHEEAALMRMLNDNSRRIFRLANNNRVAGNGIGYRVPYAY